MSNLGRMDFYVGDAYPNFMAGTGETGFLATPDKEEQEVLAEDPKTADKADVGHSRTSMIFLGVGLIVLLVVFFGAKGGN